MKRNSSFSSKDFLGLSSSDEESTKETRKTSKTLTNVDDKDSLKEILENDNLKKLKFRNWKLGNTLYYDEVSPADDVYLVQCPKNIDITALNNVDFDSAVSSIKCNVNNSKEKLTVYSIDDFPSRVNLVLPYIGTKKFMIKPMDVSGQLVMQKNFKNRPIKTEPESLLIDDEPTPPKAEVEIIDEIKSESPSPKKRRS